MLETISLGVLYLTGVYFIVLGLTSLAAPKTASRFLLGIADTAKLHFIELSIRMIVGGAFVFGSPRSQFPAIFLYFGWVLLGTTAVMFLIPWRIHRSFAEKSVPQALRFLTLIGAVSLIAGAMLIWALAG